MSTTAAQTQQQSSSSSYRGRRDNYRQNGHFHRNRDYRSRNYNENHHHHQSRPYKRGGYNNNYNEGSQIVPGSFFLGNVDKQLTREQVYDFIKNETRCYITKFDMPNVPGDEVDKEGRPIKCAGFAFVHVKHQWMANEMLNQGKIRIGNLDAEIKPYDQMKREMSERRYRNQSERSQHRENINNTDFEDNKENDQNNENVENVLNLQSSSPGGKVDWAEENNGNYNPNDYATKLGQIGFGDYYVEDDSVYQTEDETNSVISARVNIMEPSSNFSTRPNSRLASPPNGRRRPKMPVNIPQNETEIVGEITQKLLNEGITPTANNINQIANKDYNITENLVEMKKESQETVVTAVPSSSSSSQNIINNHIIQTPISVGVPSLSHDSFVIPAANLQVVLKKMNLKIEIFHFIFERFQNYFLILHPKSTSPNNGTFGQSADFNGSTQCFNLRDLGRAMDTVLLE